MYEQRLSRSLFHHLAVLALLPIFIFTTSGCTIPVYHQVGAVDTIVTEIKTLFSEVDSTASEAKLFADKVRNDALSKDTMSQNKDKALEYETKLDDAQNKLNDAQAKLNTINEKRLPAWYKDEYAKSLADAIEKRKAMISDVDELVYQSKNLATAVASYYSATARLEIISNKFDQIPEIDLNNPSTITLASQVLDDIIKETKTAQTEYNDAAASVNAPVFTRFRDAVVALGKVSDALSELNVTYAQMLQAVQTQNEAVLLDAINRLPVLVEAVFVSLDNFLQKLPVEYAEDNGDLNVKAQNEIQDWKNLVFTEPTNSYTADEKAVGDADDAATQIYNSH